VSASCQAHSRVALESITLLAHSLKPIPAGRIASCLVPNRSLSRQDSCSGKLRSTRASRQIGSQLSRSVREVLLKTDPATTTIPTDQSPRRPQHRRHDQDQLPPSQQQAQVSQGALQCPLQRAPRDHERSPLQGYVQGSGNSLYQDQVLTISSELREKYNVSLANIIRT
jgi:hypothetical protein